jgi:hypothetical protein
LHQPQDELSVTRNRKFANPFYGLLLVAGLAFVVTATAYGVMAFRERETRPAAAESSADSHPLMAWMSDHGDATLLIELGALAAFTFAAIATDDYWQRRNKGRIEVRGVRSE